ncbi:MAG: hypothetical protein ACRCU5_04000, partial [Rhizobiaceae bacterium]
KRQRRAGTHWKNVKTTGSGVKVNIGGKALMALPFQEEPISTKLSKLYLYTAACGLHARPMGPGSR